MNTGVIKDFLLGLFFIFLEVVIFQHLTFFGINPDPLLIYLLWLSLKYDRFNIILFAAALGFVQDALFDFWGLNMFSKTLLFFMFYKLLSRFSNKRLLIWQVAVIIFAVSLIHNLFFLGLSNFSDVYASGSVPILFLFGNSLYTAVLGSMLFIFKGN